MIIKTPNKNIFIDFDESSLRTRIINLETVKEEKQTAKDRLQKIPDKETDAELLAWAKANYPRVDYSVEKDSLKEIIVNSDIIINECKNLWL